MIRRALGRPVLLIGLILAAIAIGPAMASGQPSDDSDPPSTSQSTEASDEPSASPGSTDEETTTSRSRSRAPAASDPQDAPTPLARIELDSLAPRVVTATGPSTLTVTGRIVNVSDRTISEPLIRVQRDAALNNAAAARTALLGTNAPVITQFTALGRDLAPGQSVPFAITLPLGSGPTQQALQITEPGVYPLLVNLNGTPDFGDTARLATVPLLLPVLGVPPPEPGGPPGAVAPPRAVPLPLTVMWPITAAIPRVPTDPGRALLLSGPAGAADPLAAQLSPGGRLDRLVGALEQMAPTGSPLGLAMCVAVDPALLETVDAMQRGYRVATPGGEVEGSGAADAGRWMERLRATVAGRCVLPLAYGDPDVMALSRAGQTDLLALGINSGERIAGDLLGVRPISGTSWPTGGLLDDRALSDLSRLGIDSLVLEPRGLDDAPTETDRVAVRETGDDTDAVLADPLLADALSPVPSALDADLVAGSGALPAALGASGVSNRPAGTAEPLSAQDAIGALTFRALSGDTRPVLMVPPRRWQLGVGEGTELLRTAQQLLGAGYFVPRDLPSVIGAPTPEATAALSYPAPAVADEIAPALVAELARGQELLRDLQAASDRDITVGLEPTDLFDPIRQAMLLSVSSGYRDDRRTGGRVVREVSDRVRAVRASVRLVPPPGPYTLASSDSPLLISIRNDLPVSMVVQLDLDGTAGLEVHDVGVQEIPARSSRQLVVPSDVSRTGRFSVDATLRTPGGTELGDPATLQLRSTAFGKVTIALTAGAGAVLVVLVARRLYRRVRGQKVA